jgi:hypothetical protein
MMQERGLELAPSTPARDCSRPTALITGSENARPKADVENAAVRQSYLKLKPRRPSLGSHTVDMVILI